MSNPTCRDFSYIGPGRSSRSGYTLMELLLALGLSVVVILAIGLAIQIYMVSLTKQQSRIERKQVVRAVFAMISNDLRAGVQYKASDYTGLDTLLQTQITNLQAAAQLNVAEDADETPSAPQEQESESEQEEAPEIIAEEEVAFRPTLLGSESVVMIDISRLPRLDQYNPLVAAADLETQTPSDIKSSAYFVSLNKGGIEEKLDFAESRAEGGLYRREIDRSVADYQGDNQLFSEADQYTRLVAHEIAQIGFRYYDGEEWQSEWDSEEAGGFPAAIEISIVVDPERSAPTSQSADTESDEDTSEFYRYVVHLPVTDLPPPEDDTN